MSKVGTGRAGTRTWFSGLDGLRAIAVAAVVTFHFAPTSLPGGFLGVDLFFVISGYLITRLLLDELNRTGRISLRHFYERRARRLLPAVLLLLAGTVVASVLFWRDELATLRGAVLSSLGYVTNWWMIGDHQSYFVSAGRPSVLQHLWSLAIEEQFYLLWPSALVLMAYGHTRLRARRSPDASGPILTPRLVGLTAVGAGTLAILSALDMAVLAVRADIPYGADSARVYFGTDTHAMGLLLGAAAGALAVRASLTRNPAPRRWSTLAAFTRRRALFRGAFYTDMLAVLALVALLRIALTVDEYTPWLYRGGFLLISALGALLVSAAPRNLSLIPWAMEWAPVRWLGTRSYSVYLWHWPITVVTRPELDVPLHGWPLFALRCALTALLAELSYRMVERPFRIAGWLGLVNAWGWHRMTRRGRRRLIPAGAAVSLLVLGCLTVAMTRSTRPSTTSSVLAAAVGDSGPTASDTIGTTRPDVRAAREDRPAAAPSPAAREKEQDDRPRTAAGSARSVLPRPTPRTSSNATPALSATTTVSAFGDSVMLGATPALVAVFAHLQVSAVEGRQAREVFNDIARRKAGGTLGSVVVIHAGDNGIISPSDLTTTLHSLADRRRVVVLTDRVPRDWESPNNSLLRKTVPKFRNAVLVDWNRLSSGHRDWFYADGLHLVAAGQKAFAEAIAAAIHP